MEVVAKIVEKNEILGKIVGKLLEKW